MTIYNNVLEMIGNTPIVELQKQNTGPCRLFAKLELQNPGGSIKDRIAVEMIEAAERAGKLKPGGTIVEATAGNTGIGLALVAAMKGYKLFIVLPDKMSKEKIFHLRAMGAEVVMTRSDVAKGHPEYYQDLAERLAGEIDNAFYINQFGNPSNPDAHAHTTAKEIWEQMDHQVDAIVCGVGTSGTLTGLSHFMAEHAPQVEFIIADPEGSVLTHYVKTGELKEASRWLVEGIGEDFIPTIADLSRVTESYTVTDQESFHAARRLLVEEGIFAGSSTGTILHAALQYCQAQTEPKRVVMFACDGGNKYLTKMYNDYWMLDQGFIAREEYGDLRDIIGRLYSERAVVTIGPEEPISSALTRMKMHEISQLPVMADERLVGILDESDILLAVYKDGDAFNQLVCDVMTTQLEVVPYTAHIDDLLPLYSQQKIPMIMDGDRFLGMITKIDLLNYLRRKHT